MPNEVCPLCDNHCPADHPRCPRGREHFGIKEEGPAHHGPGAEPKTPEEKLLMLLRKCGHHLHHNLGHGEAVDSAEMLKALSAEEKATLISLLEKCLHSWQAK